MSILVDGTLKSPAGNVIGNADITLIAISTSLIVLGGTPLTVKTDQDGRYSFTLHNGNFAVSISKDGNNWFSGMITVTDLTVPKSINALILQDAMMAEIPSDYWSYFQAQTGILFTSFGKIDEAVEITTTSKDVTVAARDEAVAAKESAKANAEYVQNMADADTYYITPGDPDGTIAGLAGTVEGKSFRVAQGIGADVSFIYYRKAGGVAFAIADSASGSSVKNIAGLIKKSAGSQAFMRWRDNLGTVISYWTADTDGGAGFVSKLVGFSRKGFFAENTEISDNTMRNKDFAVVKSEDGSFSVKDKLGLVLLKATAGKLYLPKISAIINSATKLNYGKLKISIGSGGDIVSFRDSRGVIGLRVDKNCVVHAKIAGYNGNSHEKMSENYIVSMVQSFADSAKINFGRRVFNNVSALGNPNKSKKKVSFWIVYGQSFSVGAQSGVALSTTQTLGNVMLGGSPRGTSFGNLATEYTYSPVGGENLFYPLVEVLQSNLGEIVSNTNGGYGETIASSFANNLKTYHNQSMGLENDEDFIIGVACCGVSGRTIEQLKKGAYPEIYNRVESCLDGVAEAAAAAGYDWEVGGVIYMQGENDNGQPYSFYYPRLQSMHDTLIESCMAKSGQKTKPLFMLNQLGNAYVRGMGVPQAQQALALNNDNVILVGTYAGLSNPGAHLSANSYRQLGAIFARDAYRHMSGFGSYPFRCEKAIYKDNVIYLGFTPHVSPLKFTEAFNKWGCVNYDDKGMTVADSGGTLTTSEITATIVAPAVLKIVCSRILSGNVTVTIGDAAHAGVHNISDSSSEVSFNYWEYGVPNQYPQENNPGLVNKKYSLATFSAIQEIVCEEA